MDWHRRQQRRSTRVAGIVGSGILIAALAVSVVGCFGGGESTERTVRTTKPSAATTTTTMPEVAVDPNAAYSTFRSKDPFIPQMVDQGTTATTAPPGETPTTSPPNGTAGTSPPATVRPTTTTGGTTTPTTQGGGTTTTSEPPTTTSTTAPHLHTLRVLSVGQVSGAAVVTLQVDSSVYKDRRIGSVVSTSWGQIKVLDINQASRVVTLLHGSETLNLIVGQVIYE